MKVFLTGSTGFVGEGVLDGLLSAKHRVRCLVRDPSRLKRSDEVEAVTGDITDPKSIRGKITGSDAVIHLVGIIREMPAKKTTFERIHFEGACNVIEEAKKAGVKKFILMSALGVKENAAARYHQTKYRAEEYLKKSGLKYTVFRPSLIYGPNDHSINTFVDMVRKLPVVPVIGAGKYKMQPISLKDLAEAFAKATDPEKYVDKTYEAGGGEQMEYNTILDKIGEVLGKSVTKIHQPLFLMKPVISVMERFSFFPITSDQLTMLLEDNICDEKPFFEDFKITPVSFKEGIAEYLS
jgi:NADH dehydrogenase